MSENLKTVVVLVLIDGALERCELGNLEPSMLYSVVLAETSDGQRKRVFRAAAQARKFALDWILHTVKGDVVPRTDALGRPVTVKLTHAVEEIDEEEIARKRGLNRFKKDRPITPVKVYCAQQTAAGYVLAEVEKTPEEVAAEKKKAAAEKAASEAKAKADAETLARANALEAENAKLKAEIEKLKK